MGTLERVGRNISLIREARGWNQTQLGERIGKEQTYISKVERGKVNLTMKTLEKFAEALNEDVGTFFQREIMVEAKKAATGRRR